MAYPRSGLRNLLIAGMLVSTALEGCLGRKTKEQSTNQADSVTRTTFASDVEFLRRFTEIIVLREPSGKGQIAISPALQGRVMTSTDSGERGPSYGWINREAFLSGDTSNHMNAFGGEDRLWLGPEGGQFSIYFSSGKAFDLANWHVPRILDLEPFDLLARSETSATFTQEGELTNYSGTVFQFSIKRKIRLLDREEAAKRLGSDVSNDVRLVAYESSNILHNTGNNPWVADTGLLSIWILGMYNPSDHTTIIIPHRGKSNTISGKVNDTYFGTVPDDRLKMDDRAIYFRGDGKYRSKIGIAFQHATSWAGSYDAGNGVLTLVTYNMPENNSNYVNSAWEIQEQPYKGDVINAYNDGPPSPGARPLGPFYELETSSPAAALHPGGSIIHLHTTFHLHGTPAQLDPIMESLLGVKTEKVDRVFN